MTSVSSTTYQDPDATWPDLANTPPAGLQFSPKGRMSREAACKKRISRALKKFDRVRKEAQEELDLYLINKRVIHERLAREQGLQGEITISLKWDNTDYLDIRVAHPGGGPPISHMMKESCGGELDVDNNAEDDNLTDEPVKNVVWKHNALPGKYQVWVDVCNKRERGETAWTVLVALGSHEHPLTFSGTSFRDNQSSLATEFFYPSDHKVPPQILGTLPTQDELQELKAIYSKCVVEDGAQSFLLNSYEMGPLQKLIKRAHVGLVKRALFMGDGVEAAIANAMAEDFHCRPLDDLKKLQRP